jgi:hypothetical protein
MTPHRILQFNALSTAACAAAMLLMRGTLHQHFGLLTPVLLDALVVGLLAYAAALVAAARQPTLERPTLLAFTIGDALWVVGSAVVLVLFWNQFTPVARVLVIAVALAVDVFAMLQYRAAGMVNGRSVRMA